MSIIKSGIESRPSWTLHVPEEHCTPGLEVGIFPSKDGILIGGETISWEEIEHARISVGGSIIP